MGEFLINDAVVQNALFADLHYGAISKLVLALKPCVAEAGSLVVRAGDRGSEMFILLSGEMQVGYFGIPRSRD